MRLVPYREGKIEILVPDTKNIYEAPVFLNPRARVSRDISVLILRVLRPKQILDGMSATGIRGIRYAVESGVEEIIFNDINPLAIDLAKKNAELNGIKGEFIQKDINILCHERRFLAVDLDPFGSPSPFLQSVGRCVTHGGFVLITATDTSPLSGVATESATRKYHVSIRKNNWFRELAVRALLGYVAHHFALWEKAFIPLVSFFEEHHIRIIGKIIKKPSEVSRVVKRIEIYENMGPLWTGQLHNQKVVTEAAKFWDVDYSKRSLKFLKTAAEEVNTIGYHNIHILSRELKISPPPIERVIESLKELGFKASRSSLEPKGVKTDAPESVVKDILKTLAH